MAFGPASGGEIHNLMKGCCDYKSFKRNILRNMAIQRTVMSANNSKHVNIRDIHLDNPDTHHHLHKNAPSSFKNSPPGARI